MRQIGREGGGRERGMSRKFSLAREENFLLHASAHVRGREFDGCDRATWHDHAKALKNILNTKICIFPA